jgi:post-segregation antitoxin (ccd killing protein)
MLRAYQRSEEGWTGILLPPLPLPFLLWYASSMTLAKRKVSVSLDEDLVEELEREDQGLSAQVNVAVRAELDRRRRQRLLVELLDQLDAEHGSVDESLIEKYTELLR